jgi:zinc metalloprotease ZmpB
MGKGRGRSPDLPFGLGHDYVFMIVAADGDASNIDNFTAGESIPEWRLVPNDNNIAQRNVVPVPGGGGKWGLMAALDGMVFLARNPHPTRKKFLLDLILPEFLLARGWGVVAEGIKDDGFVLASGGRREITLRVHAGGDFTAGDVEREASPDIQIAVLADDNVIGGMTCRLDPELKEPFNAGRAKRGIGQTPTGPNCAMLGGGIIIAALIIALLVVVALAAGYRLTG